MFIGHLAAAFAGGFAVGWITHKNVEAPRMVRQALGEVRPKVVVRQRTVIRDRIVRVPELIERIRYIQIPHIVEVPRYVTIGGVTQQGERTVESPAPVSRDYSDTLVDVPVGRSRRRVG